MKRRQIFPFVLNDLKNKMVFIAGPRQCGKTTLAYQVQQRQNAEYYNWDNDEDRYMLRRNQLAADKRLWIFDELHKYNRWRNWLKGTYDQYHKKHRILVTGSAKLDVYSRGGDSLQGRYYMHHLHPFTFSELAGIRPLGEIELFPKISKRAGGNRDDLTMLVTLGGFPEPLFSGSQREAARWRLSYTARLVRDEIRSLENIKDLDSMELLYDQLETGIGSVLSINSLREDLGVAFNTVKNWIRIFEQTYAVFQISPYGPSRIKAVKKEKKLYFWDWGRVESESARFENLVAVHLQRLVHWAADIEGLKLELRYFRNTVGHEVDFVLLKNRKPWVAVEVKRSDKELSPGLKYFLERVQVAYAFQVSLQGKKDYEPPPINGCQIRILPAIKFLSQIP